MRSKKKEMGNFLVWMEFDLVMMIMCKVEIQCSQFISSEEYIYLQFGKNTLVIKPFFFLNLITVFNGC